MRVLAIVITVLGTAACGGITDNSGDSGAKDAPYESEPPICANHYCADYCIHPSTATCPTCVAAGDAGTCPAGSTLQDGCPAGPAMPPGQYCVTYPPADPEYCSPTVPPMCSFTTPAAPADIQCMAEPCGA
jgi:hypothetical protein